MTKQLNWAASDLRKKRMALKATVRPTSSLDEQREDKKRATAARLEKWKGGDRGVSTRGAQGCDAYARRNYTAPITLPKLKFLENDDPSPNAGVNRKGGAPHADAEVTP